MLARHFTWGYFSRYYSLFLHKGIWVLFSRGGNFREEDKNTKITPMRKFPRLQLLYWFRCMDLDHIISLYSIEYSFCCMDLDSIICLYSIEYWFRCMDLDGDGVISMYEMEYFYEEQMQKMESMGIEKLPFEDCLCQVRYNIKFYRLGIKIW